MKTVYGEFCSHHNDAVSFFKELQQNNKRFQTFVKVAKKINENTYASVVKGFHSTPGKDITDSRCIY